MLAQTSYTDLFGASAGAQFSDCGRYRYQLWRIWDVDLPKAMCIGLNPSTADASRDDPTIRLLKKVLARLGYGGFYMCNLYGWISSKPKDLEHCADPVGDNDKVMAQVATHCDQVIFCWGNAELAENRTAKIEAQYPQALCFGLSKAGRPVHPLALMYSGKVNNPELAPVSEADFKSKL